MTRTAQLLCAVAALGTVHGSSEITGLPLEADGSYLAAGLHDGHWNNATCTPGGYRDFYIDATTAHEGHDNLFIEAIYQPGYDHKNVVELEALALNVYYKEIPFDRKTEHIRTSSPDGLYSVAINANEIKHGRYFISVQCGDDIDGSANFAVLAKFQSAELHDGEPHAYLICPNELLYQYLDLSASDVAVDHYNVRFKMCVPPESQSILSLVTRVHYPPLRRAEPMILFDATNTNFTALTSSTDIFEDSDGNLCSNFDVCNSALGEGKVWAGVFGAGLCGEYNVTASLFGGSLGDGLTCETEVGGASLHENDAIHLELEHVSRGSCDPYEWVDYKLDLTEDDRKSNIVFEITDQSTGGLNPESLSVHIFTDTIPVDRLTENRADRSVSSVYAVFKNYLNLNDMTSSDGTPVDHIYLSVHCGPNPSSFKVLGEHVVAKLTNGHSSRGEVCSGSWVYHYITVPESVNATASLDIKLFAYEGFVDYTVIGTHPPIRIAPPYGSASVDHHEEDVIICNVEAGLVYYVGVQIGAGHDNHCAVYDITAKLDLNDAHCETARQSAPESGVVPTPLTAYVPVSDAVDNKNHKVYSMEVDAAHSHDNLLIEVELTMSTASSDFPNALEVLLFEHEVPTNGVYESPFFAATGSAGLWTIAVSAHDLKQETYYVVVKGAAINQVRYRVAALLIESELIMGHRHHGEICEGEWLYFSFNAESLNSTSSSSSHRRLAHVQEEIKDHAKPSTTSRQLAASSSDDDTKGPTTHGHNAIHMSVTVWRYSGSFFIRLAHGYAPIKLVPPFMFLGTGDTETTVNICDIGSHGDYAPETVYLGIVGSKGCALVDVVAHTYIGGNCTEPRNFAEVDPTAGAEEMILEHYTHSSCSPGGFTDLFVNVTEAHATDNIIFEVEPLGDVSDPSALTVLLYPDEIPDDRASERRSDHSANGIYSVAVSSIDVHAGYYFLSVQCKASGLQNEGGGGGERLRFRVAPLAIKRDLVTDHAQHGELCPLEWMHHMFKLNDTALVVDEEDTEYRRQLLASISSSGSSSDYRYHLRMHIWKYTGDFYAMLSDHAPFKLMAPYSYLSNSAHEQVLDFCDVSLHEEVWVGLFGGHACAVYDINVVAHSGECISTSHDRRRLAVIKPSKYDTPSSMKGEERSSYYSSSSSSSSASSSLSLASLWLNFADEDNSTITLEEALEANTASELIPGHLHLSSCTPGSWVDFYLHVGDEGVDVTSSNILFEVLVDQASKSNPDAISMYLHAEGKLPDHRDDSEIFTTTSTDGVSSLAVPTGLVEDDIPALFLSVRCGASPVRFKAVAVVIDSALVSEKHSFGEVCPGGWVYFKTIVPEGYTHVDFEVTKYEGSMSLSARSDEKPMRLTYPYVDLKRDATEESTNVYSCDDEEGQVIYLGVKGGHHCASFTVTPHFFNGECSDEKNVEHTFQAQEDKTVALHKESWMYSHCERGGWAGMSFRETFTKGMEVNNVLVEVEALMEDADQVDSRAIAVYVYKGAAPPSASEREASFKSVSLAAKDNMHTIFQSYVEINKLLDELEDTDEENMYLSFAMKCSDDRDLTRFRIMLHETHAKLSFGHRYHGSVCPGGWVFHLVDLTGDDADDGHRRLGQTETSAQNVRYTIRILQGGIYRVSGRLDNPPGFNSDNKVDLDLMAGSDPLSSVALGHVVEYDITLCNVAGHKAYIGLFGDDSGCALYDVSVVVMGAEEVCVDGHAKVELH